MKMPSTDDLRVLATVPGVAVIQIPASCGPIVADALEIADESARHDLLNALPSAKYTDIGVRPWWDIEGCDPIQAEMVERYVRYLESRGLLERHAEHANWVSPKASE